MVGVPDAVFVDHSAVELNLPHAEARLARLQGHVVLVGHLHVLPERLNQTLPVCHLLAIHFNEIGEASEIVHVIQAVVLRVGTEISSAHDSDRALGDDP